MKQSRFDFRQSILFENENYLLVNKPPFLSTLEDRNENINLLRLAREVEPDAQVCHRLDKDTSGILAIARNQEAYRHLAMQFESREVKKVYHAIVDGLTQYENQTVEAPIAKQRDGTVKIDKAGKDAVTGFTTLQCFKEHSLVQCEPVTGRMHQIRIHLALLGTSICGDELYGGKWPYLSKIKRGFQLKKNTEEEPLIKRMALHAFSISFKDLDGRLVEMECPYPKDFKALLRQLSLNLR